MTPRVHMCTIAVAAAIAAGLQNPAAGDEPTVAGVWSVTLLSHQLGLELAQEGTTVTGTLHIRGTPVEIQGTFVERRLEITAVGAKLAGRHGGEAVELQLTGTLTPRGTLEGRATTPRGLEPWTAERLGRRR